MNFLLDTNAIIYLVNGRLGSGVPGGRYGVSVITEIELLSFPDLQLDEEQHIRAFLAVCDRVANAVLFSNDGRLASSPNLRLRAVPLEPS